MLFAIVEDQSQSVIESNSPFSSLANFFDSLILEFLDEVLLNPILKDGSICENRCIHDRYLLARDNYAVIEELLDFSVIIEERCPFLLVFEIKLHQHWEVRFLYVDIDIVITDYGVNLLHRTHWVIESHFQVLCWFEARASRLT